MGRRLEIDRVSEGWVKSKHEGLPIQSPTSLTGNLPEESKQVLRIVLEKGRVRGFELKKFSGLDSRSLIYAIGPLVTKHFIAASGSLEPDTIDRVNFAPLTSGFEFSQYLLG
jgi:hypothetical protein